jgi:hypothetical protein
MRALQSTPFVSAKRRSCISRARTTISRIAALVSRDPLDEPLHASTSTGRTLTWIAIRSSSGPEIFPR